MPEREPFTFLKLTKALAGGIMVAAVMVGVFAYKDYSRGSNQDSWLPADARITKLNAQEEHEKNGFGEISTYYQPNIYYEYKVNQGKHVGLFSPSFMADNSRKVAENYLTRFHLGDVVQAYYDPKNPDNCVVIRTDTLNARNLLWQSAAAFCLSLLALIWATLRDYDMNGLDRGVGKYGFPRHPGEFFR